MTTTSGMATHQMAVLGALGEGQMTTDQISAHLAMIDHHGVATAAFKLIRRGLVERLEIGSYRLTDAGRAHLADGLPLKSGPRGPNRKQRGAARSTLRQRVWNAIRLRKRFVTSDILTLVVTAGWDEAAVRSHIVKWFGKLERAGYLARAKDRVDDGKFGSNGELAWVLIRDTGDVAPVIKADGTAWDHNTKTRIGGAA